LDIGVDKLGYIYIYIIAYAINWSTKGAYIIEEDSHFENDLKKVSVETLEAHF